MKKETFHEFNLQLIIPGDTKNKILYKGKEMYRYVAYHKFGTYKNLIANRHIKLTEVFY